MDNKRMANVLRGLSADMVTTAKSGHPGLPLGMADVVTVLFAEYLQFYPADPLWSARDRFILSAGHGSALLYSLLYLTGYPYTLGDLKAFRSLHSKTPGHPEYNPALGVEATTGPLGQGIGFATGVALQSKLLTARYPSFLGYKVYTLVGDGDLMEGISHEALAFAGTKRLSNLIIMHDDNGISIDGELKKAQSFQEKARMAAYGFTVITADGHDINSIQNAFAQASYSTQPVYISFRTHIGYGSDVADTAKAHGSPLSKDSLHALHQVLHLPEALFAVPEDVLKMWRSFYKRVSYRAIHDVPSQIQPKEQATFMPKEPAATRINFQELINRYLYANSPFIIGSADLTESTGLNASSKKDITPADYSGNFIHYGIREHAMGAIMNGLSAGKLFIPVGSTFLVFSDYMRPAMRLSALMNLPVIYVFSHDSFAVGEDGPTHQPIEQLATLRAIPKLTVHRPADGYELQAVWKEILNNLGSHAIILSRQSLPAVNNTIPSLIHGAYVVSTPVKNEKEKCTLIGTGSEVARLQAVAEQLSVPVRLVSIPTLDWFIQASESIHTQILGTAPRVILEASLSQSWVSLLRDKDLFLGVNIFGVSASAKNVETVMEFSTEQLVQKIKQFIK